MIVFNSASLNYSYSLLDQSSLMWSSSSLNRTSYFCTMLLKDGSFDKFAKCYQNFWLLLAVTFNSPNN